MSVQALAWLIVIGLDMAGGGARVQLVDDRSVALTSPVEACFQVDLRQDCVPVAPGSRLLLPDGFRSLRIEGSDHGPLVLTELDVKRKAAGGNPLPVLRKAALQVRNRGKAPLALSLYALDDQELRRPAHRLDVPSKGSVKVPAGEFLASLSQRGSAPDLHLATFAPGGRHSLGYRSRPGWSLVLRVIDAESRKPVPEASIALRGIPGYSLASSPSRAAKTERRGLALFSGLTDAMMQGTVRHPGYVEENVRGLLASPGTFSYQAVGLEIGGRVRAAVLMDGQPAAGASCEIARYTRRSAGKRPPPEILFQGSADISGICLSRPLATGSYILRVSVPDRPVRSDKGVAVVAGQETGVEIDLTPIRIHGTARLGAKPAQGFHVNIYSDDAVIPQRKDEDAVAVSTTDEDGEYEAKLRSAGKYSLALTTPRGTPATAKWQDLEPPEEVVDFQLDEAGASGVVVDEAGKPVAGAAVVLRWQGPENTNTRAASSEKDGTFYFPMVTTGPVVLQAHREDYRSTEPLTLEFISGVTLGPLKLVLRKERTIRGVVTSSAGGPVAQAWVASYAPLTGDMPFRIATALTQPDGSFEIRVADAGAANLVISGPGCPLAAFTAPPEQEVHLPCAAAPAALGLAVKDRDGRPLAQTNLILRKEGIVLPRDALAAHLGLLQLPAETDGSGRLTVAGLAPGNYDVFLATATTEGLASQGTSHGYLGSFSLPALFLTEVEVQVGWEQPVVEASPHHP